MAECDAHLNQFTLAVLWLFLAVGNKLTILQILSSPTFLFFHRFIGATTIMDAQQVDGPQTKPRKKLWQHVHGEVKDAHLSKHYKLIIIYAS